ncbi:MAG: right-handed parallel beta-helix repeat-containing protein [Planctomycetota bacterium]|nr:right-handed parallel beta-helix repeat-containing protein [Planctomycetota bacterium]
MNATMVGTALSVLVFAWVAGSAFATEFHVAPAGDDTNAGTKAKPFGTLTHARDAVRTAIAAGMTGDIVVVLHGGKYYLTGPILFDERDGGRDGHRVIYRGAPGESAEIVGGTPITGWEKWKDNIYRAKVAPNKPFYCLFVDGRRATLARYPKKGSGYLVRKAVRYDVGGKAIEEAANAAPDQPVHAWGEGIRWAPGILPERFDVEDAQVFGWKGCDWFSQVHKVTSVDLAKRELHMTGGSGQFGGFGGRGYLMGILELLTEEGEWCLKNKEGYVYYWPRGDIDKQEIVAPVAMRLLEFRGSGMDKPVRHIRLENLSIRVSDFAATWSIFSGLDNTMPPAEQQGMVFLENAEHIELRFCRLTNAGHAAVYMNHWAQHNTVYGCWIQDTGHAGIYMNGFAPNEGPFKTGAESDVNKHHLISNNYIADVGQSIGHSAGVEFYQSGHNEVSHNVITRSPRYGIAYKGVRFGVLPETIYGVKKTFENHFDFLHTRDNKILYNELSNLCRDSSDYGAIEAWGPGRDNLWEGNVVHDMDQAVHWDAWAHALFSDDATHYHTLRNNIIFECKGGAATRGIMVKSLYMTVENNILSHNWDSAFMTLGSYDEPAGHCILRRNILDAPAAEGPGKLYDLDPGKVGEFQEIDSNVIWPRPAQAAWLNQNKFETNSVFADPQFDIRHADWDLDYTDFQLKPGSPALKLGFQPIDMGKIGLRSDFPFDRSLMGRRSAHEKIQAEDYDRMRRARTLNSSTVGFLGKGSWLKYKNVDFGKDGARRFSMAFFPAVTPPVPTDAPVVLTLRLDSLEGPVIGRGRQGELEIPLTAPVQGVHTLFLSFEGPFLYNIDWFRFLR